MARGIEIGDSTIDEIHNFSANYCCLFRVEFNEIVSKTSVEHPLSSSKCRHLDPSKQRDDDWVLDNGRIVAAKYLETTITEQDLFIYEDFYTWEHAEVHDLIIYRKQYLPTQFVKAILDLYKKKTELKDVEGQEVNYMVSKGMLNSAYGMTVTDIIREQLEYDGENYHSNYDGMTDEEYTNFLDSQIERYNYNRRRFLFYPWGVWVTAYARRNLFNGIINTGSDYVYSDTDSIKIRNPENHFDYINHYNDLVVSKLKEACDFHKVKYEMIAPKNKYGKEKPLGVWDFEGIYDEFKTLGAKRYMWRKGDKWNLTVSGVNKSTGIKYLLKIRDELGVDPFDQFTFDLVVPSDYSGRLVLTYIHQPTEGDVVDYLGVPYHYQEESSVHMEPTQYSMDKVLNFIEYLFTIKEEMW